MQRKTRNISHDFNFIFLMTVSYGSIINAKHLLRVKELVALELIVSNYSAH